MVPWIWVDNQNSLHNNALCFYLKESRIFPNLDLPRYEEYKIGVWHKVNQKKLKTFKKKIPELNFFSYLKKIGYKVEYNNSFKKKKIIKIFQMKFRPEKVDGKLDYACYEIAKSLNNLK